jgi:U2 small nuclear ribonucleoprotein A'
MRRLTTLFLSNNYIFRIGTIGGNLSSLSTLVLTNNRIASLTEIDNLASLTQLELLSLMDNPLTSHVHYRLYVIHKIPSLKCLDYQKVTREERDQSRQLFASQEGVEVLSAMEREKLNHQGLPDEAGAGTETVAQNSTGAAGGFTERQREFIRSAIEAAQTKEEMDKIEHQLRVSLHCSCHQCLHPLSFTSLAPSLSLLPPSTVRPSLPLFALVSNLNHRTSASVEHRATHPARTINPPIGRW